MNSKASSVSEGVKPLRKCRLVTFLTHIGESAQGDHFPCTIYVPQVREFLQLLATLSPPLPSLEVERRALKLLARHTCFSAYSAAEPLCIHFDFGSEADRIAAANALDEAFAALSALPLDGGLSSD